jgi:hypothetical protein
VRVSAYQQSSPQRPPADLPAYDGETRMTKTRMMILYIRSGLSSFGAIDCRDHVSSISSMHFLQASEKIDLSPTDPIAWLQKGLILLQ